MKNLLRILYVALPAVLLAQTSKPVVDGTATSGTPVEQAGSLPKSFPPEVMPSSSTASLNEKKLTHKYCAYPDPDRKSVSIRRCDSVPEGIHLIAPIKSAAPEKKPKKKPAVN
jgi:hypothetical protein